MIIKIIIIYIILAIVWAFYAAYRTSKFGKLGKLKANLMLAFTLNLILFPYCLYYVTKYDKW